MTRISSADMRVAKELVAVAKSLQALDMGQDFSADPVEVSKLADKFLARMGSAKSRQLRMYGLDLRPSDTVESLAKAWATVLLAQ